MKRLLSVFIFFLLMSCGEKFEDKILDKIPDNWSDGLFEDPDLYDDDSCSDSVSDCADIGKAFQEIAAAKNPVLDHGFLKVSGKDLLNQRGEIVQLKGMSLFWSNWGFKYWNDSVVKNLSEKWGVTVVRAAMGIENSNGYLENAKFNKEITKKIIRAAIANNLYVIVDWHDHAAHLHRKQAIKFFDEISREFGTYPNLIYEIYNEPMGVDWKTIKAYAEPVIAKIRANGSKNLIIVGTPTWSQDVDSVIGNALSDENVAYAMHFYASTHKWWLRERGDRAMAANLPIFVSEFGLSEASGDGVLDLKEARLWMSWMNKHKISWLNWSVFDKAESSAALKPGAAESGDWTKSDLTQSGLWVKRRLSL